MSYHIIRLKQRAFTANRQAKASKDEVRAAHYRAKDAAMNTLLRTGFAYVDEVDWSRHDPVIGLRFFGGGKLHIKISCLDSDGLRAVRHQINGDFTPQSESAAWQYDQLEPQMAGWN